MKKRILFLLSDTGGGHRAAAAAIAEAIDYLYPQEYDCIIDDIWAKHTFWPLNKLPQSYAWITENGKLFWRLLWIISTRWPFYQFVFKLLMPLLKPGVSAYFQAVQPHLVISVHPLMNHLGLKLLRQSGLNIPFVTVITDMISIHPTWIFPEVTACVTPTYQARETAIELGMPAEKISVCGQPVGLKFNCLSQDKTEIRRDLGLIPQRKTVMIMSGGEGSKRVFDIARAIAKKAPQTQLIIISGRNIALKNKLEAVNWEVPTRVYGFVDNIPQLMNAADILITKAGPGTISEAFVAGLPPLISGYIPGQEAGNVRYVQQHQAGAYAEAPHQIASLVQEWMNPHNNALKKMAHNAANLARPQASLAIAMNVCRLI